RAHRLAQDTSGDVPMPQQERRQTLATLMNSRPEDLRKLMKSFTRTSLGIIEALTNENGQSLSELAMKLHRSPETISAAVKRMSHRLVERGLTPIVNVEPDPDDRRVKRVRLDTKWRDHVADARSHLVTDG